MNRPAVLGFLLCGMRGMDRQPTAVKALNKNGSSIMIRTVLAMALVAGVAAAAVAQSDPIKERQGLMKRNGKNQGIVNRMVRGQEPFDVAKVNTAFTDWADAAKKLPALFQSPPPPGAKTRALPKIWENKADFEARLAALGKAVDDNKDKAKTLDELKVSFPKVSKVCNDCHETYRRPRDPGEKKT
jgi:cytochrome c556